jgi:hypothetical protein
MTQLESTPLVDGVSEVRAVARAPSGVGVEHQVPVGGVVLVGVVEAHVVHPVGTAVDVENERVFLVGVEVRGLHDPALHVGVAGGRVPDLLDVTQALVLEHVVVHVGEARVRRAVAHPVRDDVGRIVRGRADPYRDLTAGHGRQPQHVRARSHLTELAVHGGTVHVHGALVSSGEVDAVGVRIPVQAAYVTIQVARKEAHARSVQADHVELRRLVRLGRPVEARERDPTAIW